MIDEIYLSGRTMNWRLLTFCKSMKYLIIVVFLFISKSFYAQRSCGGGVSLKYKELGIRKVEEYKFYSNHSHSNDSIPRRTLYYNHLGQITKEQFNDQFSKPFYTFKYNEEGFLVDIDTNGRIGIGIGAAEPITDTIFSQIKSQEWWFNIDTIQRLQTSVSYVNDSVGFKKEYQYNSYGQITSEYQFSIQMEGGFKLVESIIYEYNEQHLLIKCVRKNEETKEVISVEEYLYYYQ